MTHHPRARIYRGTPRNLVHLAGALRRGELVAVPTETVYGLAANALDARACRKIYTAKGRPATDPLIVHLHSLDQLPSVAVPNSAALRLAKKFWPGPLTMILPKNASIPDAVTAGMPSVAVRMPRHPLLRRLLKLSGLPLAAPSANQFGCVSPTSAEHVRDGLGRQIRHILDGGPSTIGIESTIVDLRQPRRPRLLRPGIITKAELEDVLGVRVYSLPSGKSSRSSAQLAPGMLKRHYSPKTPVKLHRKISHAEVRRHPLSEAWVFLARPRHLTGRNIFWLAPNGDLRRAARHLFHRLREVDAQAFVQIHVERARGQPTGLATAINDRLRRAAASR